jgi:eukaryotic-like serine/threonine-protein kinase
MPGSENRVQLAVDSSGPATVVTIGGEIDESAVFARDPGLHGRVTVDLQGVTRLNSCGVRHWLDFIGSLQGAEELVLRRCAVPFVTQLNTVVGLHGGARVESIMAPFACQDCGAESVREIVLTDETVEDPESAVVGGTCAECGGVIEFDELPERYFAFLLRTGA